MDASLDARLLRLVMANGEGSANGGQASAQSPVAGNAPVRSGSARTRQCGRIAVGREFSGSPIPLPHRRARSTSPRAFRAVRQNPLRATVRIRKRMAECKDRDPLLVTAQWRGTALRVVVRAAKGPAAAGLPATVPAHGRGPAPRSGLGTGERNRRRDGRNDGLVSRRPPLQ